MNECQVCGNGTRESFCFFIIGKHSVLCVFGEKGGNKQKTGDCVTRELNETERQFHGKTRQLSGIDRGIFSVSDRTMERRRSL